MTVLPLAILSIAAITAANARHKTAQIVCDYRGCSNQLPAPQPEVRRVRTARYYDGSGVIGSRPAGCPYEFCGCEASLYLYGEIIPELNLASNWMTKFPRAEPAPGMAAARYGHVMVLLKHIAGNDWLVHDGNSGGHLTREHVRSISGYTIVNPQVTLLAKRMPVRAPSIVTASVSEKRETASKREAAPAKPAAAAPLLQLADASPAVPLPLPRRPDGEVALQEMAAVPLNRMFPNEWIVAVPLEQVSTIPLAHVAAIRTDWVNVADNSISNASREPAALVPALQVAAIEPAREPRPHEQASAPVQVAAIAPEPTPRPHEQASAPVHLAAVLPAIKPRPHEQASPPVQVAAIATAPVPLPRGRIVDAPPVRMAALDPVPLPRERVVSIPSEYLAATPINHVPLPRERVMTIPPEYMAAIPLDRVPLPRERFVSIAPESATLRADAMAEGQLKQAAVVPAEHAVVPQHRMLAAPVATDKAPADRHARTTHRRQPEPTLIDRAASAAGGALKKLFSAAPDRHHRRGS